MPKGGARSRSGPPPTRGAIRNGRNGDSGWTHLPAGREGDPPAWPLGGRPAKFEAEQWAKEWARPQAVMWERRGWEVQVAIYVRTLRAAASPKANGTTLTNLMRQMVNLGLTDDGLARLRWILPDDVSETAKAAPKRPPTSSARERMRVIEGGGDVKAG